MTLRLRGDRKQRLGLQTYFEGRAGPKENQVHWVTGKLSRSRFPAQIKMVGRTVFIGRVYIYVVGLLGVSWRKLMESMGLLRPLPTPAAQSFRVVQSCQAKILLTQI